MFRDEVDLLECRLTELEDINDLYHVIVEADVTHGGNTPREYVYPDVKERFAPWADRIVYIQASGLPDDIDAWSREHAQREWCWQGLKLLDAQPDDIVLHGDLDEIPTALAVRYVKPRGFVRFKQTLYTFAVDWQHPEPWWGTLAGRVKDITGFANMRDARCHYLPDLPDAGWHLSWLGTEVEAQQKMDAFCHPEVKDMGWYDRLGECYQTGLHVDGTKLLPVDVDASWPRWIREGNAPASWFRPR
jgi:hypothetical protein